MPATFRHRRLWLAAGWFTVAFIVWASLREPGLSEPLINDKLAHALAYCALTFWFCHLHARPLTVAAAALALGGLMEILQGMSGYRDMSLADLGADALGIALGVVAWRQRPDLLARIDARLR